jgi:hypothetical protein
VAAKPPGRFKHTTGGVGVECSATESLSWQPPSVR